MSLYIEQYTMIATQFFNDFVAEFFVGYGQYHGIVTVFMTIGQFLYGADTILMHHFFGIGPGIVYINLYVVALQVTDDVDHFGIANVGAVFLKGNA